MTVNGALFTCGAAVRVARRRGPEPGVAWAPRPVDLLWRESRIAGPGLVLLHRGRKPQRPAAALPAPDPPGAGAPSPRPRARDLLRARQCTCAFTRGSPPPLSGAVLHCTWPSLVRPSPGAMRPTAWSEGPRIPPVGESAFCSDFGPRAA